MRNIARFGFHFINAILGRFGLTIRNRHTFSNSYDLFLSRIARMGFSPSLVIDVGVASGTPWLYDTFPQARLLLVEPLKEYEATMKTILSHSSGNYIIAAAGDRAGRETIYVHDRPDGSSLLREEDGEAIDGTPREIGVVRLDEVIGDNVTGPIAVKVDVQGTELRVLEGLGRYWDLVELIILEVSFIPTLKGAPDFTDIIHYMHRHGFVVYDIPSLRARPLDGALQQGDVAFIRVNSWLRSDRRFAGSQKHKVPKIRAAN